MSTTPTSAAFLLNAPFVWEQARHLARRVLRDAGELPDERVEHVYLTALSRRPRPEELELGRGFLAVGGEEALVNYCHVILGLNEFIYVH